MIGKITRVPLREVWKHEAHDFTQWLEENIEIVSDAIDLDLSNAEREKSAGSFSVDLVAEDHLVSRQVELRRLGQSGVYFKQEAETLRVVRERPRRQPFPRPDPVSDALG